MPPTVSRFLSGLADPVAGLSDADVLGRYADRRDPQAFAELVRRFGPVVLGVCRRALGDGPDADDAFQATFLSLARQAGRVRDGAALPAWLHRVAARTAGRARARRQPPAPTPDVASPADPFADVVWRDLRRVLDDELDRLPEKYRGPVVLCLLDGCTRDEAARRLGYSLNTLKRRLDAGRALLRDRLTRRGLGPVAVAAGVATADGLRAAVPDQLAGVTARFAAPVPAVPAAVAALAGPTTRVTGRGVLAAAAAAVVLAAAYVVVAPEPPAEAPARPAAAPPPAVKPAAPPAAGSVEKPGFFLWPIRTDLQKELAPGAGVYVLIDGTPALADGSVAVRKLPLKDLREALELHRKADGAVSIYLFFPRNAGGAEEHETLRYAAIGVAHEAGAAKVMGRLHLMNTDDTWADIRAPYTGARDNPDATEPATSDGGVKVYPVRTAFSRFLSSDADCVAVLPPLGNDAAAVPETVRKAVTRAVAKVNPPRKRRLHFVIRHADGKTVLDELFRFATDLGFGSSSVTQR